jgi:hypothetical protein
MSRPRHRLQARDLPAFVTTADPYLVGLATDASVATTAASLSTRVVAEPLYLDGPRSDMMPRVFVNPAFRSRSIEMQGEDRNQSGLGFLELQAIDLTITALQRAGHTIDEISASGNPHEIMAEAVADAHHPFVELNDRDREIIAQIKDLAGQLSVRASLPELLAARARLVQGG